MKNDSDLTGGKRVLSTKEFFNNTINIRTSYAVIDAIEGDDPIKLIEILSYPDTKFDVASYVHESKSLLYNAITLECYQVIPVLIKYGAKIHDGETLSSEQEELLEKWIEESKTVLPQQHTSLPQPPTASLSIEPKKKTKKDLSLEILILNQTLNSMQVELEDAKEKFTDLVQEGKRILSKGKNTLEDKDNEILKLYDRLSVTSNEIAKLKQEDETFKEQVAELEGIKKKDADLLKKKR